MKTKLIKDKKKRQLLQTYERKRILLKQTLKNKLEICQENPAKEKLEHKLHKLPRNSSGTRVKNRCILTGRGRSPLRKFKLSRLEFRRKAAHGFIPGVTKTSWLVFIRNSVWSQLLWRNR